MNSYGRHLFEIQFHESTIYDNVILEQPPNIKTPLKMHQHMSLKRMIELESDNCIVIDNTSPFYVEHEKIEKIHSSIGFLCDDVGSGKSLTILSLISQNKVCKKKKDFSVQKHHDMCFYSFVKQINVNDTFVPANLIIVPHSIINQWKKYIQEHTFGMNVYFISKNCHIPDSLSDEWNQIFQSDIIIVSSTMMHNLTDIIQNIRFSRVILDEADSMKIPGTSNTNVPKANFVWIVSASVSNILGIGSNSRAFYNNYRILSTQYSGVKVHSVGQNSYVYKYVCDVPLFLLTFRRTLMIRNDSHFIQRSMELPDITIENIVLNDTIDYDILNGVIPDDALEMVNGGDIRGAIQRLHIGETTPENLIDAVVKNLIVKLENLELELHRQIHTVYRDEEYKKQTIQKTKELIQNTKANIETVKKRVETTKDIICILCYEKNENEDVSTNIVLKCCQKNFCMTCISTWLNQKKKCPHCREKITLDDLIYVTNTPQQQIKTVCTDNWKDFIQESHDKYEAVLKIMNLSHIQEDRKYLIFSNYLNTFETLQNLFNTKNISYEILNGSSSHIENIIKKVKSNKNDSNIIMMNINHFGTGLNLEFATDIIIFHSVISDTLKQIIGRAQRIGRNTSLRVWQLLYRNEN